MSNLVLAVIRGLSYYLSMSKATVIDCSESLRVNQDMLEALRVALQYPLIQDEYRLNCSRVNNREGTVEAIQIARKNAQAQREEMDKIMRTIRAAIAQAEGE